MNAGDLRKHITIQSTTKTKDTDGSEINVPVEFASVHASMITTGGKEFYAAQKINAETTAVFKIRYLPGIKTTMQIKYMDAGTDRYFDILFINNVDGMNRELLIQCREVV